MSGELRLASSAVQGWSLLLVGPFVDYYVVDAWVLDFQWNVAAAVVLASSCALAIAVNVSQFACLGACAIAAAAVAPHLPSEA